MISKKTLLLIFVLFASMIPEVRAITPKSQTAKITDTHDDAFILETGVQIDSSLVSIKDPGMDLRAFLVFREIKIDFWEPLKNATLRLHTSNTLSFDADSSVTIYGIDFPDLQDEGWLRPSDILSMGFTSAHTDYNTSQFYGGQWHEIDVTDIVEELIRDPRWDGDGWNTQDGDAIGFHILGAEGDDKRYFYDYLAGNGLEAQLVIHWNFAAQPPSGVPNPVYNETYRGYTIWTSSGSFYEIHLIDYREWEFIDQVGGYLYDYNVTGIMGYGIDCASDKFRKRNATADSPLGLNGTILYEINVYGVNNYAGADLNRLNWAFLSFCNSDGSMVDNNGNPGYEHISSVFRHNADNATNDIFRFANFCDSGLGASTSSSDHFSVNDSPFYVNVTWDFPAQYFSTSIYSDRERTNLLDQQTHGPGYGGIEVTGYAYHMVMNTYTLGPTWSGTMVNITVMSEGGDIPDTTTWVVADENGTVIDDELDSYEDAIIVIEDLLGADPGDPDPPGQGWEDTGPFTRFRTRLYILLLGIAMLFGPPMVFAYQRPSGYSFVIGLFIMLIGLAFMIASGSI